MSDEFIAVATKEVNSDIESFENILKSCTNDADIFQNSSQFQKYTHKIKGLAPMMGKESLGNFSSSLDDLFKKMIDGANFDGIYEIMVQSIQEMKTSMIKTSYDFGSINDKIKQY